MQDFKIIALTKDIIDECVDIYINTFSKEPWNDEYDSRNQIVTFFNNHIYNNYFLGYVGVLNNEIVALSLGMKKPWIKGMEYYIDEFCVSYQYQGKGIGTLFIKEIELDIKRMGLNAIMLNTEKGYPAEKFYRKNGFDVLEDMIILAK
ncbi:MAG: GNAT family N-acetyltransferase [Coprobacillaceae bacterium]